MTSQTRARLNSERQKDRLFKPGVRRADAIAVRWFSRLALACAVVSSALSVAIAVPAGASTTDLGSVVLSQTLPGYVATSPGPTNGPITQSNASLLTGNSELTSQLQQDLANGSLSGYLRIWIHPSTNGVSSIVILAFRLPDADQAQAFLWGLNRGVSSVASGSFGVPSIAGASGFSGRQPLQGHAGNEYSVTFGRDATVFEVEAATITQALTADDAISVADSQAGQAGGPVVPPTSPSGPSQDPLLRVPYVMGEAAAVLGIVALVLYLIRRERRRHRRAVPGPFEQSIYPGPMISPGSAPAGVLAGLPQLEGFAVPSVQPVQSAQTPAAGWYPDSMDPSRLRYFDGAMWTAHTSPR